MKRTRFTEEQIAFALKQQGWAARSMRFAARWALRRRRFQLEEEVLRTGAERAAAAEAAGRGKQQT